jgi:predicted kinase
MPLNDFDASVEKVFRALAITDQTTAAPVLLVISGLPGTGKSFLARRLAERLPCVIVESDFIRKTLAGDARPTYSGRESALVHRVAHAVIKRLLESGRRVIYDATTLAEWQREKLYHLADQTRCKLVIIRTIAPEEVARERLTWRRQNRDPHDLSDADWNVHQRMKAGLEPVRHPHLVVDTSGDIEQALTKILRAAR